MSSLLILESTNTVYYYSHRSGSSPHPYWLDKNVPISSLKSYKLTMPKKKSLQLPDYPES